MTHAVEIQDLHKSFGRLEVLNRDFHPKSAKEELKEELDDLAVRQATEGDKP
jgi:hypothetical protein